MLCWQIIESSLLRPDYLTYFNQLAGGPKNGYKHLVDSSLDWGQDLPALKTWLDQHPNQSATGRLYLAYFGTALPRYYGIEATGLPFDSSADKLPAFEPGTYCISATTLQHVYSLAHGKWTREYESAYRLALAREVYHFDLTANDSFINSDCALTFVNANQPQTLETQSWFFNSINRNWIRRSTVRQPSWRQVSKCDCDLKPAGRILN